VRFSLSWIQEYAPAPDSAPALARRLTLGGLAVDRVETPAAIPPTVIVGRILEAGPHPNADRLSVCTVDVGDAEPLHIVCGAPNARAGLLSPVARVGTTLPNGVTLKRTKIRGELSEGMLCSEIELGLGDDADGIIELPAGKPGTPLSALRGTGDTVFDIDVPSNRGDCLCHVGVAREVAALTGTSLALPAFTLREEGEAAEASFAVTVEDPADCPLFTAHVIRGVTVGPSPEWLVRRLESAGQRSISNIVDVTNFVMLETGQPLHSFDLDRLGTNRIHVRRARKGERLTTLDGADRELDPEVLLITDGTRPIAAAGVMGGANTEVHDTTENLLLEAACFRPERVLWGSRKLRLDTEASLRFRRGVDPGNTVHAARRAAALLAEVAGGTVAPGRIEVAAQGLGKPRTVALRPVKVGEVLGEQISEAEITERLQSFGFTLSGKGETLAVTVPSWRRDVLEECDLVEEVARHRGYDAIGVRQYNASAVNAPVQPDEERRDRVRHVMQGFGFQEAVTRTLTDRPAAVRAGLPEDAVERAFFPLQDPPSREEEGLRVSLVPSLLTVVAHNLRHDQPEVRVYEIGKTFHRMDGNGDGLPTEVSWVGLAAAGGSFAPSLERSGRSRSFPEFKGVVEELLAAFRIDVPKWRSYTGIDPVPEGALEVLSGDAGVGFAWDVSSPVRSRWDLNRPVFVAQIRLEALPADTGVPIRYREPSRYPAVRRDLALIVPETVLQDQVRAWIRGKAGAHLRRLELFDFYRGKHIPAGHLGLGYRLTFRAEDRTLEEREADEAVAAVLRALAGHGITRRDT
jgi:phenylalanyl-tRNA synthetase beta chain